MSFFGLKKIQRWLCYGVLTVSMVTMVSILWTINFTRRNGRGFIQVTDIDSLEVSTIFKTIKYQREKTPQIKHQTTEKLIKYKNSDQVISSGTHLEKEPSMLISQKPLKIYIYTLPKKFNDEIIKCLLLSRAYRGCFDLTNNGMGKLLFRTNGFAVMDSNQFSLEVIIHQQLLKSSLRTTNISEADIFYVPAYMGLACFCGQTSRTESNLVNDMYKHLQMQKPFQQQKPHFSTLAKIEREQTSNSCSLLKNKHSRQLTFIGIEKEANEGSRIYLGLKQQKIIVAPYPSYIHYYSKNISRIVTPSIKQRNVFIFMAASVRRSNAFRSHIIDQFQTKTKDSYQEFYNSDQNRGVKQVMLVTSECLGNHKNTTIPWMLHSVFCLQPPGDSPTRKSFYDAILSGCIPVLFHYFNKYQVRYPFDWRFNYTDFTIILPAYDKIQSYPDIYDTLQKIPAGEISRLHFNLQTVARYFQYSVIEGNISGYEDTAMFYIIQELKQIYNIS
ncbi:hypothetical protein SNE40_021318 [Patella caerulea]|uniref:Exostosin GT47 domain-containing protein n=1 Tax=Patella caerulea TaxID=87958 RepID=A0AAN8IXE1_PATCE